MPGKPIATLTSMHVCPLCSGTVPHVGGPVTGPGAPTVLINGKPAALMGDMCVCVGPPDTIVQGNPAVLINGTPVACVGDMTAHGGSIIAGDPTVMISTATPKPSVTMPLQQIPFPNINILDDLGAAVVGKAKSHKAGKENIEKIKKEASEREKTPSISNVRFEKNENMINNSRELKEIIVKANVFDISDGEVVDFELKRKNLHDGTEEIISLSGTVNDGMVETTWKIEEYKEKEPETDN